MIAVLWAASIFSILSASLAFNASQTAFLMKREIGDLKARTDFTAAVNYAASLMNQDPYPHEDSPQDAWYGRIILPEPFQERVEVNLEDEESKLNLNTAPEHLIKNLLKTVEEESSPLKGSAKDYAKHIIELRSGKRIKSFEELLLMEDLDQADYARLGEYLTVYPELDFVNINTVKPLVLRVLVESLSGDHAAKFLLLGRLGETHGPFLKADLTPEAFMERLKLPRTPLIHQLVQDLLSRVTADSETFRIKMETRDHHQAEAVFRFRAGALRPEILFLHE